MSPILRQLDPANGLTLGGLTLSFLSVTFAVRGQIYPAILCMMYAGIADLFDGFVARRMHRSDLTKQVGKHLDSLVDVCSFGFAPAVFGYCFGLRDPLSVAILAAYVACNALRLAYYDSTGLEGGTAFTGLPVTYAALVIPVAFTANLAFATETTRWILLTTYPILGAMMVSGLRIPKPKGAWYGLFGLLALALTGVYVWAMRA